MKNKLKTLIGVLIGVIVLLVLIYWAGIVAPRKEVVLKKEMVEDIVTHEILLLYKVYYKWDGVEQQYPRWLIFNKESEWKVLEFKDINLAISSEENRKFAVKFDSGWFMNYKFSPQPTRYQTILSILGFQPIYDEEKGVFFDILHQIKELQE